MEKPNKGKPNKENQMRKNRIRENQIRQTQIREVPEAKLLPFTSEEAFPRLSPVEEEPLPGFSQSQSVKGDLSLFYLSNP